MDMNCYLSGKNVISLLTALRTHRRSHGRHPPVFTVAQHGLGTTTRNRTDLHGTRTRNKQQLVWEPYWGAGESLGCTQARRSLREKTGFRQSLSDKLASSQRRGCGALSLGPRLPDLMGSSCRQEQLIPAIGRGHGGKPGPASWASQRRHWVNKASLDVLSPSSI